jgi:hypothetical protein
MIKMMMKMYYLNYTKNLCMEFQTITEVIIIDNKARVVDRLILEGLDFNQLKILEIADAKLCLNKKGLEINDEFKDTVIELIENENKFDKKFKKIYLDLNSNNNDLYG